jgi:hypothetical protein
LVAKLVAKGSLRRIETREVGSQKDRPGRARRDGGHDDADRLDQAFNEEVVVEEVPHKPGPGS